eukprot:CAMPEP_0197317520 /NCGR_PEP_ID=MMETSP0891-20130614/47392_1 /TAXON_ID=44058 ORGANISM="Aureoumbra lagunensis, Strain CCMP1510" /NCGR_SAMPLE_ID=MMETSP0891 /ASSEMBLY_ACC=CAM_ASM_000534 /LENGTH=86 /DNA_ID=CAMNT_0042807549 /DNA_START=88 /DNA_END=348 /DNA_ORIENTATION=-
MLKKKFGIVWHVVKLKMAQWDYLLFRALCQLKKEFFHLCLKVNSILLSEFNEDLLKNNITKLYSLKIQTLKLDMKSAYMLDLVSVV